METDQVEVDKELSVALRKIHECQVIYTNAMGKYDDKWSMEQFRAHCKSIISTIKDRIADNINCQIEEAAEEKYDTVGT